MYKKVMWATDGSDNADRALAHAKALATDGGGPLTVVYCEEFTLPGKGGGSLPVHANEEDIQAKIERQVAELSSDGPGATLQMTTGKVGGAAPAIAEIAAKEHTDVIVVGTRGHTAITGLLLGGVAQRLLHIAPCPVLAVPPERHSRG
jgi:nucleotide-binding universal stress UspA family protein